MDEFKAGDVIEHRLMPGFSMTVLGTEECETDGARPVPHLRYNVTDPEGNDDWLCAYDVQKPGEGLPLGGGPGGPRGPSFSCGPNLIRPGSVLGASIPVPAVESRHDMANGRLPEC